MKLKKPKKEEVKILVVDDETIVALDIKTTLQKYGYKVVGIAGSSSEALRIVKTEKPNLILMDIMLKGQKDGIETSEEINKIADIPIIFLTAYSDDNTLERAKLVEPYGYLIKPFDNRELFTTIEMSLYKHSMEMSIRESEESLAITLNSIGDGVISTDEKGLVVRMNPVAEKLTGWKLDEAKGKHLEDIFKIIDATTRESLVNPVDKVIKSGKVIGLSNHTILISKSGKEINISDSAAPIRDNDGEIRGVVLVFSDVTESYKAREEMQKSEEKFRALVTQMQQGLAVHEVITDKKGKVVDYRFLEINDSYEKLTGLKRKRIIGKTVREVLPDIEEYWIEKYGEVALTGVPITYENYVQDLNNHYEVVAYRNQPNQFAVIVNNITERKNTENKLRQNQEILTDIFESVKEGLTYATLKGKIISVNKALLEILELNQEDVIGADLKVITKKILPVKSFISVLPKIVNVLNGTDIEPFELEYKNKVLEISAVYNSNSERIIGVFRDITERKRAQERIGLMASLLDLSPASVIVHDMNGNIIYANKKTLEMHGYTEDQFLQLNLKDIDTPESAELIEARIKEIIKKGELKFEVEHIKKDGTSFPLLVNTRKAIWGHKEVLLSVSTDITDRKLAEQKIRESEEKFRSYIENAPDAIMVVDRKGNYLMANNAAAEMTGYSIDELTRMHILDVTHPDDHVKGERHFKNVVEKGEAIDEVRYITKKGEVGYWSVKAIKLDDDRFLGFQSDITERKLAEKALFESEERFALAIDASEQGIWDWNLLTNHVYFSPQWKKQIGYEDSEIINEFNEWTDHLHPDDRERCLSEVQSYLQNPGKHFIIEFRFRHKDGSYRWIHNKASSILGADGKVIRMFGSHLDITERKLAEAAIQLSESKFNIAFHASPVAMAIQDDNGLFIDINLALIQLTGYTREEIIGKPGIELNLWADQNQRNYVNSEFEKSRVIKNFEFQFRRKNGNTGFGILSAEMININGKSASLTTVIDITERKSAESALSASESKFRSLVTSLNDIVYTLDNEQRHTGVFGEWITRNGLTPEYFIGRSSKDIFGEDASKIHEEANRKVLNGENVIYEWSMDSHDFKKYYQTSVSPLRDSNGTIIGIVGVARDISDLKMAEEKIRESEEKFRSIIQGLNDSITIIGSNGLILYQSPAAIKLYGFTENEMIGKNLLDFIHPDDHELARLEMSQVLSNSNDFVPTVYRILKKDGSFAYLETVGINMLNNNSVNGIVIVGRDVTERIKIDQELKNSELKYRTLVENLNEVVMLVDNDDRILFVNQKFEKLFGYTLDEVIGKIGYEFLLDKNDKHKIIDAINQRKEKISSQYEACFLTKNGERIIFFVNGSPIYDASGNVIGSLGAMTDITERKRADEELERTKILLNETIMQSPLPMVMVSAEDFKIKVVNKATEDFLLIKADDYLEKSLFDIDVVWQEYTPEGIKVEVQELPLPRALQGLVTHSKEMRLDRRDGTSVWQIASGAPIFDSQGKLIAGLLIMLDITDRKRAEEELRESEDRFSRAIAGTGAGLWDWDMVNNKVFYSPQWKSMLGYKDHEVENDFSGWKNLWHPEDGAKIENAVSDYIQGKTEVYEIVHRLKHKDGSWHWILTRGDIHRDASGNPIRWVGTNIDITERKKIQDALKEKEEKYSDLFNTMPNGYYRSTHDGYFVDANPAFIQMLGYESLEELKSIYIPKDFFVQTSEREDILTSNPGFISNVETYRLKRKDGKIIWVEDNARYIKDESGNVIFNEGICKDITDRKNAEDALRESEQLFNTLAQVSPVGIFRTDPDGLTTYVNPTWSRLSGLSFDEALGNGWLNALHPDDREKISHGWKNSTLENDVSVAEYRFLRPDGNILWVMGQAIPEFDSYNRIVGYVGTITDITDRKHSEDALRQSEEKFRAITEQTNSLISLTDANGIITYASPSALEIFNYLPEEMVGRPFMDFLYEEDIQKAVNAFREAVDKIRVTKNLILRMKRKDGSIFYGELNGSDFHSGESRGSLVVIQDISERIKSDQALKLSEERFRVIAEKTGTIVYDRNLITNKVHREGAILEVLGYSKQEYNSFTVEQFNQLLHEEDRFRVIEGESKLFENGGSLTQFYRLRHKDGNYVQIEDNSVVLTDENGKGIRLLGSMKDITERKLTEEALRESEELHRKLLLTVPDLIVRTNLKGEIIFVNESTLQTLGYVPKENLLGKNMLTFIAPKDKERANKNTKLMMERSLGIQEYTLVFEDGYEIISEVNGDVIVDSESNPIGMVYVVRDITERKKAEENLRKLSHAVEQSQVSIVITNKDGVIEYVNPKFCEVTGYSIEEVIGQNPRILKSGEWKPESYKGLWNNITTGRNWTGIFHNRKKNGELFWESAHISPIKNESGFVTHFIAVKEDITEKVKAEEELIRYREHLEEMVEERTAQVNSQNIFLRTLIDTIPNPIFVKDTNGNYTDVNPAFEKLTGKSKEELLGANLDTVLEGRAKELALETDEKLLKGEAVSIYEIEMKNASGAMVPFIVYKTAFGFSEGKPEGILGLLVDISERKQMEEKTVLALNREKELNEMKTNFISMASHEFRTPLTTILASADLVELYHQKWSAEKILNHIKKIQDSVNYMTTLLDDVLTLSRADRGKLKFSPDNLNLRELCNEIIKEISYQAGPTHHLLFDCKLSKDYYVLDRKLLTQILNNLLSNAVKFSPEGGNVSLNILEKEEKIEFIVSDEGLGIDQNDLNNIFEPFFRGKNVTDINGSGLGLNIVKNAVELHGGHIKIESELNKGTKIMFTVKAV